MGRSSKLTVLRGLVYSITVKRTGAEKGDRVFVSTAKSQKVARNRNVIPETNVVSILKGNRLFAYKFILLK